MNALSQIAYPQTLIVVYEGIELEWRLIDELNGTYQAFQGDKAHKSTLLNVDCFGSYEWLMELKTMEENMGWQKLSNDSVAMVLIEEGIPIRVSFDSTYTVEDVELLLTEKFDGYEIDFMHCEAGEGKDETVCPIDSKTISS